VRVEIAHCCRPALEVCISVKNGRVFARHSIEFGLGLAVEKISRVCQALEVISAL